MARTRAKETDERNGTERRLDAIIRLLMDGQRAQERGKKLTKNDQVLILDAVGLQIKTLAKLWVGRERMLEVS